MNQIHSGITYVCTCNCDGYNTNDIIIPFMVTTGVDGVSWVHPKEGRQVTIEVLKNCFRNI